MVPKLNFDYFCKLTLNLTGLVKIAKNKVDLEFWQWVWKAKYVHLLNTLKGIHSLVTSVYLLLCEGNLKFKVLVGTCG